MNILESLRATLAPAGLFIATGVYKGTPQPDGSVVMEPNHIVLTPLRERNDDIADDAPLTETQSADVNLYFVGNYQPMKKTLIALLREAGFFLADRVYIGYEAETSQHHFVLTVEQKEVL